MKFVLTNFPVLLSTSVLQLYSFSSILKLTFICVYVPLVLRLFLQYWAVSISVLND